MLFASAITRSVLSAKVGNRPGRGVVEVVTPVVDETGVTVDWTGQRVEVFNNYGIEIPAGIDVAVTGIEGQLAIVALDPKCSVQLPGMGTLYFLTELPKHPEGLQIELGDWVEIPSNVHAWPEGITAPEQVLCRSKEDPNHYKLFKYRREIEGTVWEDSGLEFGGTFSAASWESLNRAFASLRPIYAVPSDEGR